MTWTKLNRGHCNRARDLRELNKFSLAYIHFRRREKSFPFTIDPFLKIPRKSIGIAESANQSFSHYQRNCVVQGIDIENW